LPVWHLYIDVIAFALSENTTCFHESFYSILPLVPLSFINLISKLNRQLLIKNHPCSYMGKGSKKKGEATFYHLQSP